MRQRFISKEFRPASMATIETADAICTEYAEAGYDLSLRQLYYQFVARGLLENTEENYKRLGALVSDARLAGLMDWDHIKDRGRRKIENSHWTGPAQILDACAQQFRIDTWADQPNHVIVMVEKEALQGVLEPVCKGLDVAFIANKGYSSQSAMYEIARELHRSETTGRSPHVIYLGDHDPSGIDMSRDVAERLSLLAETPVTVHRVALNMDQVRQYGPPENPAKVTDSRAAGYIAEFGHSSWELDALEPRVLADLVTGAVEALRDDDRHAAMLARQQDWRDELASIADEFRDGDR